MKQKWMVLQKKEKSIILSYAKYLHLRIYDNTLKTATETVHSRFLCFALYETKTAPEQPNYFMMIKGAFINNSIIMVL
jgi:hypothetical protein